MESFSDANNLESDQMSEFSEEASDVDSASDCEAHSVQEGACDEDVLTLQMSNRGVRTVYLITYIQANCTRFPTREEFANIVFGAFCETKKGQSDVVQWVCSREDQFSRRYTLSYGRKAFTRAPMTVCKELFG